MTENEAEEIAKGDTKQLNGFMAIENNLTRQYFKGKSLTDIYSISPKLKSLMDNIKRLDYIDMQTHGRLYKHYIYSRPKGYNTGITLVEAVFELMKAENYNVLDSSKIDSKVVLKKYNSRPGDKDYPPNIHGEQIRFIGLSDQYKEGIDLFDVKYAHIFEQPTFETNLQQIMGRGTRFCGQSGLKNPDEFPWNLHVFIYKLAIPRSMRNLYKLKNGSIFSLDYDYLSDYYNQFRVGNDDQIKRITEYAHYMSIDYGLTQNYIPLDIDIPNIEFAKIQILEPYQRTVLSKPFRPYEMDLNDIRRQEEVDKLLMSLYDKQDTLKAINDIKNKKALVYEPPKQMTQDEIVSMALIELRSVKPEEDRELRSLAEPSLEEDRAMSKQVTKSIPQDGIMPNIFSFLKSMSNFKKGSYDDIKRYKIVNEKECTVKIGKAKKFSDDKVFTDDRLISYPVVEGGKIHNICFLRSELLSLISENDGKFTVEIMVELKQAFRQLNLSDSVAIDVVMSDDFKTSVLEYNNPIFSKTSVESSLITVVLDMMISWMEHSKVDPSAGLFYRFLNMGGNALKAMFRYPLKMLKWILMNPMLSSVFYMLAKILKIGLCIYTSDMKTKVIDAAIDTMKVYIDKQIATSSGFIKEYAGQVAKAFTELLRVISHCLTSYVSNMMVGNVAGAITDCLSKINFKMFNLTSFSQWIMDAVVGVLSWSLGSIKGFDFSSLLLLRGVIKDPYGTLTKLVFGKAFGSEAGTTMMETLSYYMKGDLDILAISILLELIPFRFMYWFIDRLIDLVAGVSQMVYIHKMLIDLKKYMNGFKYATSSCLRLLSWIINTYKHHEIIWYIIRELKVLFTETIPCLYANVKGYLMKLYDPNAKDAFMDCCFSDIQTAVQMVLTNQYYSDKPVEKAWDTTIDTISSVKDSVVKGVWDTAKAGLKFVGLADDGYMIDRMIRRRFNKSRSFKDGGVKKLYGSRKKDGGKKKLVHGSRRVKMLKRKSDGKRSKTKRN